ncbi:LytTR family DNA-binding domain-containing protein [Aliisedimentitalea scapharcae]|uniref:LytTR family DNA-binding domain-containing protein n=1 Tax=Aliisedimentitalea scapharcae TaxID=1524259 RepID=A0ABZ2XZ36_9RHOB
MLKKLSNLTLSAPLIVNLLSYVSLALLLAYSGPFGTLKLGHFGYRLVFWGTIVIGAVLVGRFCRHVIDRMSPKVGALQRDALVILAMTVLVTPLLWGFIRIMAGNTLMVSLLGSAQYVVFVTAGFCVFRRSLPGSELQWYFPVHPERQLQEDIRPRIARRLPDGFVYPVLRLTVDDHMVEVVGPEGAHKLRMRFADAIEEMEPIEGVYTHRSHWITRTAIARSVREDGQVRVQLVNGDLVPVSRKHRKQLEEAQLL